MKPLSQALPGSINGHGIEMDSLVQERTKKVEKVVPHKYAYSAGAVKNVAEPEVRVQKRGKAVKITGNQIPDGKRPQQHMLHRDSKHNKICLTKKGEMKVKMLHTPMQKRNRVKEFNKIQKFKKLWEAGQNRTEQHLQLKMIQFYAKVNKNAGLFSKNNSKNLKQIMTDCLKFFRVPPA